MKSRVTSFVDFKKIEIPDSMTKYGVDESKITQAIFNLSMKNAVKVEENTAQEGDTVYCKVTSQVARFNKENVAIKLGKHLFNEQIEESLVGCQVGEIKCVDLSGEKVTVQLLKVVRNRPTVVTDEMISAEHIDGVSTVEEYKQWLRTSYLADERRTAGYHLTQYITAQMRSSCELDIDHEECTAWTTKNTDAYIDTLLKNGINPYEQPKGEEKTQEELYQQYYDWMETQFYNQLLSSAYALQQNLVLTQADYDRAIEEYARDFKVSEQEARERMDFNAFVENENEHVFFSALQNYVNSLLEEDV